MHLIAQTLTKTYGEHVALRRVSVAAGCGVTALLGPNGSGKSTLLRLLATVAAPDSGTITFCGRGYHDQQPAVRAALGYLPQHLELPGHLTPRRLLHYLAGLKHVPAEPQTSSLFDALGLNALANRRLDMLSGGERRRVGIAQALLGEPSLLLLDELMAGLDLAERGQVRRLLAQRAAACVILFSTHVPEDAEAFAQHALILRNGATLAAGSVAALCGQAPAVHEVDAPLDSIEHLLQTCLVSRVIRAETHAVLRVVGALPPGLAGRQAQASLEDAYLWMQRAGE
jgi:ABC-2 type transport system ATP-binding protein